MNTLKQFENFEEYYTKIDKDTYYLKCNILERTPFRSNYIIIDNLFYQCKNYECNTPKSSFIGYNINRHNNPNNRTIHKDICIQSCKDDWYYVLYQSKMINPEYDVNSMNQYYKCDQLDGLILCLKKLIDND